jgi:hypothetical protein
MTANQLNFIAYPAGPRRKGKVVQQRCVFCRSIEGRLGVVEPASANAAFATHTTVAGTKRNNDLGFNDEPP